ncbi:ribonuclease HII [Changchengzhania lutea]|uniref:ribonuclease HII n=1 Tax=Changchengzhania lutea TaxID=2049305 RepID=UPI00115CD3FD|nr:ribonuclease HII [Changchengzhania lutea]
MRFFWVTLIFFTVLSCSNTKINHSNLIDFVPKDATVVLRTSNLEGLKSAISTNEFLQNLSKTETYKSLESSLFSTSYFKPSHEALICISGTTNDSLHVTFISKNEHQLFNTDSLTNYQEETLKYKTKKITKSILNSNIFYSTIIDSTFISSSSKTIIDNMFEGISENSELEKLYHTTSLNKGVSFIISNENPLLNSFFIEDSLSCKTLAKYLAVDVDIQQNNIIVNGIATANDTTKYVISLFKGTVPQENQMHHITPSNSDGFMSFTFDDFKILKTNLSANKTIDSLGITTSLFDDVNEIGVIYEDDNSAIVLNSIDIIATKDALIAEQTVVDSYRQVDIYSFSNKVLFKTTFSPLIQFTKATKYCVLDDFFVFADSVEILQNIIASYQNKTTLSVQPYYQSIMEQLSNASSLLVVAKPNMLQGIFKKNGIESSGSNLKNYNASAIQFIYDTHFAHVNAVIKKNKSRISRNSVSETFNIQLENDLLSDPQFVTNHVTKLKDIVVQDINNTLYLISNTGKIRWKKQLHGPVLGDVFQIDMYKNGRLQMAFATPNRVYVLDRNGNSVAPFPKKFNDDITQPLAVFDYDKKRNYRFLVTQGRNLIMYNTQAKVVSGFTFKKANKTIISQPKHFRIGSKDYITIKTSNKLYILDRLGRTRVSPNKTALFSTEAVFLYRNKFTTTSKDGNLFSVDTKGNVAVQNLNISENHHLKTTSKTLVILSDNTLNIRAKNVELDYGNYAEPKLFYIKNKIYVSITDLQTHKVFLYDSQGQLLSNFPVYGNSPISLDNIDKDNALEFVTKGERNSIILYQVN